MTAQDREVAGLRCTEVLERLSDYVDGELDGGARAAVDAHLAGCDWCERFGGAFAETVGQLRRGFAGDVVDDAVRARLAAALDVEDA